VDLGTRWWNWADSVLSSKKQENWEMVLLTLFWPIVLFSRFHELLWSVCFLYSLWKSLLVPDYPVSFKQRFNRSIQKSNPLGSKFRNSIHRLWKFQIGMSTWERPRLWEEGEAKIKQKRGNDIIFFLSSHQ